MICDTSVLRFMVATGWLLNGTSIKGKQAGAFEGTRHCTGRSIGIDLGLVYSACAVLDTR